MTTDNLKQLHDKLQTKLGLCLERNNTAFVIGGTKDLLVPVTQAYLNHSEKVKNYMIILTNNVSGKTQDVAFSNIREFNQNLKVIYFGVKAKENEQELPEGIQSISSEDISNGGKTVWEYFNEKVLADIIQEVQANSANENPPKIHIALDMESVDQADGVTERQPDTTHLLKP